MRNYWYIPAAVLVVMAIVGFFAGWQRLVTRSLTLYKIPLSTKRVDILDRLPSLE